MHTLNLGILAHVDAGKTSLTERLLHAAGVIDEIGRVDDGSTQTDSLALERQRGITIKSAVVSFVVGGRTINLIDTPGHPDFIAEVERILHVLDGAVLVVSAVEGVQAQSRVLMRTLQRLRIPTLVFVNKIDRRGAGYERVLRAIGDKLAPAGVAMGTTSARGTPDARFVPFTGDDEQFSSRLVEVLAEGDDALLAAYVDDEVVLSHDRLGRHLAAQTRRALVHPVFFGSAVTGAGVAPLIDGLCTLLPAADGDADGPVSGAVFKIDRGSAGEKSAYVRLFSGTVRTRDPLPFGAADARAAGGGRQEAKVTAIEVFDRGSVVPRGSIRAGQIGRLRGLGGVRVGDAIGASPTASTAPQFAPPSLETVVIPRLDADMGPLRTALAEFAEQDPLIAVRQDDVRQELSVSLYGEVQKEVIQATLAHEYGLEVAFRETTTICVERPGGTGTAVEVIRKAPNPFLATVGLRVEPAPTDAGVTFRVAGDVLGTMPFAFFTAVEDAVAQTLPQGLYGWQVTDCTVTMTHSGYAPRQSHAHQGFNKAMSSTGADFRGLTPLVLMSALKRAGTTVCEPLHRFHLEVPEDTFGAVVAALGRLRAVPHTQRMQRATYTIEGEIPAGMVHELQQRLPELTRGEGVLESVFHRYDAASGPRPTRPRTDHNPLDRREYLLHVLRRV